MILMMSVLGIAILLIAAFDYVLIAVSSLARRAKSIGVHKCCGATDNSIFRMFLTETALVLFHFSIADDIAHFSVSGVCGRNCRYTFKFTFYVADTLGTVDRTFGCFYLGGRHTGKHIRINSCNASFSTLCRT